jgi:hypothetical protein
MLKLDLGFEAAAALGLGQDLTPAGLMIATHLLNQMVEHVLMLWVSDTMERLPAQRL